MTTTGLPLPSSPYGAFTEKGYAFTARLPASDAEERAFLLEMRDVSENLVLTLLVPMSYAPRFGVDVGDSALLEAVTDALLAQLPDGGNASVANLDGAATAALALGATRR